VTGLETKVSRKAKDILQKYASGLFTNATLDFYGVKTAKIKEIISVELPVIEVGESFSDTAFLLEDNSLLHYEFATGSDKEDNIRYAMYDLRLYRREGRNITTVIIYTSDVKEKPESLNIGSLAFNPYVILMHDYDGNAIYEELDKKIKSGQDLTDTDMLNLIFLPLMRNTIPRGELAVNSVKLAQTITNTQKKNACTAAAFAFAHRYLNENELEKLKGAIRMTTLVDMVIEDAIKDKAIETAKWLLKQGMSIIKISEGTGLSEEIIEQLQAEEK